MDEAGPAQNYDIGTSRSGAMQTLEEAKARFDGALESLEKALSPALSGAHPDEPKAGLAELPNSNLQSLALELHGRLSRLEDITRRITL